jgi:hypothetical protein
MIQKINKKWLGCMALLLALAFASCKKDGPTITATSGTTPGFTASTTDLQCTVADSASTAVTFNWTPSNFGVQTAINYTFQLSTDSTFAGKTYSANYTSATNSQTFTVNQFNNMCLLAGVTPNLAITVYVRIQCSVAVQNSAPNNTYQYSPVIAITVDAPYALGRVILYPYIWAPGDYQSGSGWAPGATDCAKLYSVNNDGKYAGYIMFPGNDSSRNFKLTSEADWDHTNFGWETDTTLSTDGGAGNLWAGSTGPGYYLINADTIALTWSATLQNWGICGTVEGNGWDNTNPIQFSFDATNQVLVDTLTCVAGDEFKFIVNDAWTVNLGGDYDATSGNVTNMKQNGDNITIPTAGTYIVTLDLRVPSEPVCTILPK